MVEDIIKTIYNMLKRQHVETIKLSKMEVGVTDEDEIEKTETLIYKLESAILELDDTLMLFNEF